MVSKARYYLCTVNFNQEDDPVDHIPDWSKCKWLRAVTFQLERGEKSGKLHWQCCVEFKDARTFLDIHKIFPMLFADLTTEPKNIFAARNYCHKADTRAGPSYSWERGHYVTTCLHQKTSECKGASAGIPASWLPRRIPRPSHPSGDMAKEAQLKLLLQNKIDEMMFWQAYLDTGVFPKFAKARNSV